ncbi:MAG: hypothetical protein K8H88_07765, partial [Sandaracinaceae bacterium]|nr:hypothetical protein [Sandaracinaceae bacterium]
MSILLAGCSEPTVTLAPVDPPERSAVEDRSVRALVRDVASARACGELEGRFMPLPEDVPRRRGVRPNVTGRLWLSECEIGPEGDTLSVHVAGRGWQWVERSSEGPLGSSFTVRGTLRVEASLDLRG